MTKYLRPKTKDQRLKTKIFKSVVCGLWSVVLIWCLGFASYAATPEATSVKEYDGLWFAGFNFHKDLFGGTNGQLVRQAVCLAIDRAQIAKGIIGESNVPTGVIPIGMLGYDASFKGYAYDIKKAKSLMNKAGYPIADKRLKEFFLLHTDGVKTKKVAQAILSNLGDLGIKVQLKEIQYKEQDLWQKELESGKHHMFLMGYKAGLGGTLLVGDKTTRTFHELACADAPAAVDRVLFTSYKEAVAAKYSSHSKCQPKEESAPDVFSLLRPLFHSQGEANFGFYSNDQVDILLDQLEMTDEKLSAERDQKLKRINALLQEDPAGVNLFYITRL